MHDKLPVNSNHGPEIQLVVYLVTKMEIYLKLYLFTDNCNLLIDMFSSSDDSDSDSELVRVDSSEIYSVVPEDKVYKLKIKSYGLKSKKLLFTLKQGQELPFQSSLLGNVFLF